MKGPVLWLLVGSEEGSESAENNGIMLMTPTKDGLRYEIADGYNMVRAKGTLSGTECEGLPSCDVQGLAAAEKAVQKEDIKAEYLDFLEDGYAAEKTFRDDVDAAGTYLAKYNPGAKGDDDRYIVMHAETGVPVAECGSSGAAFDAMCRANREAALKYAVVCIKKHGAKGRASLCRSKEVARVCMRSEAAARARLMEEEGPCELTSFGTDRMVLYGPDGEWTEMWQIMALPLNRSTAGFTASDEADALPAEVVDAAYRKRQLANRTEFAMDCFNTMASRDIEYANCKFTWDDAEMVAEQFTKTGSTCMPEEEVFEQLIEEYLKGEKTKRER